MTVPINNRIRHPVIMPGIPRFIMLPFLRPKPCWAAPRLLLKVIIMRLRVNMDLSELLERYGQVAMPVIRLIDTKKFFQKDGSKVICTPALQEAIRESLDNKKQVILFRNRRGYSPYQVCKICGWIPQCKNCDVSLTFHKLTNKLLCHYCGTSYPPVNTCAACGNHEFIQRNFGTEKIEEELGDHFS